MSFLNSSSAVLEVRGEAFRLCRPGARWASRSTLGAVLHKQAKAEKRIELQAWARSVRRQEGILRYQNDMMPSSGSSGGVGFDTSIYC